MARSGTCIVESEETFSGFGRLLRWEVRLDKTESPGLIGEMTLVFEWRDDEFFDSMYSEASELFDCEKIISFSCSPPRELPRETCRIISHIRT